MKKKFSLFGKVLVYILLFSLLSSPAYSACKKKAKKSKTKTPVTVTETPESTPIKLPVTEKNKSYFYKIDTDVLAGVENGTPATIAPAMRKIHKSSEDYTEPEKVLIYIAASIYELLWPSEAVSWTVFPLTEENQYTGAIKSVKSGIFDSSTGNTDFLTSILPAFVLLKKNIDAETIEACYESIQKAAEYNADSALISYLLGKYYFDKKDYANAVAFYKKAFDSDSNCFEIGIAYAEALNKTSDTITATAVMTNFAEKNPDNILVLKQNAYIAFEQKDYTSAENYVARVLQQTPNDLEFVLFRAKIFIEKNDYIHAVSLLDMYARQNDTNIDYLLLRARVQLDWSKNFTAASDTVEKAIQLYPDNSDVLMLAARISSTTDSPVAGKYADELAQMVLEQDPENTDALVYALDGLIQRENWAEAYPLSKQLVSVEDPSSSVILRHVKVCLKNKKSNEAMETASKAYNADKTDENLIQAYVLAYVQTYSRDASLSLINTLMNTSTQKIKSFLYYRRSFLQRGEENILADLRSSLIANPRNDEALFRLYEIYYAKKDYRKAQYYLRQVVAIKPNDSSIKKLNEALTQLIK